MVGCSDAVAPAPTLVHVESHLATGLITPFGVAFAPVGKQGVRPFAGQPRAAAAWASAGPSGQCRRAVLGPPSGLVPARVGTFPGEPSLLGLSMSPDARDLMAAVGSGTSVFSGPRLEQPGSRPSSWLLGSFDQGQWGH